MGQRLLPRTLPELFSYSLVVEREAARRFATLGRFLRRLAADALADELDRIGAEEHEQFQLIALGTSEHELPELAGWELRWHFGQRCGEDAKPSSAREALAIALAYERCAQAFYEDVADHAHDDAVRAFAAEMSLDEQRHIERLERLLEREAGAAAAGETGAARF
ncbi:MAG TPA: hypothetical protein VM489_02190 [Burkholderiales bacterium]|nr:hypothetical protein [Burkholderiales bacterium]